MGKNLVNLVGGGLLALTACAGNQPASVTATDLNISLVTAQNETEEVQKLLQEIEEKSKPTYATLEEAIETKNLLNKLFRMVNTAREQLDNEKYEELKGRVGPHIYRLALDNAHSVAEHGWTTTMEDFLVIAESCVEYDGKNEFQIQDRMISRRGYTQAFYSTLNTIRERPEMNFLAKRSRIGAAFDHYQNAKQFGAVIDLRRELKQLEEDVGREYFNAGKHLLMIRNFVHDVPTQNSSKIAHMSCVDTKGKSPRQQVCYNVFV